MHTMVYATRGGWDKNHLHQKRKRVWHESRRNRQFQPEEKGWRIELEQVCVAGVRGSICY